MNTNRKAFLNGLLSASPSGKPLNFTILMGFAADWIGAHMRDYYLDARVLARASLVTAEAFGLDILQAISDPYREAADAGLVVDFPEDDLPISRVPLLRSPDDLRHLRYPDPDAGRRMSDRLEAVRLMKAQGGGELPVMGWVEGALAEAADIRGLSNLLMDMVDRPEWVHELLEICAMAEIAFARAQVEAGADIIGLGDAAASQISPAMYREFALPYEQRIFAAVHEAGARSRLHICGNTSRLIGDMGRSGAQIIDLDWMVSLSKARSLLPEVILCGNADPVAIFLQGDADLVKRTYSQCRKDAGERWIAAAGCEIPRGTDPRNLKALAEFLENIA